MYKDYILRELEKITVMMARLVGFKEQLKPDEFIKLADTMLQNEFNIKFEALLKLSIDDFEAFLIKGNYKADKLDALAQLLYMHAEPFSPSPETLASLQKILLIFEWLEKKHRSSSFENINKQNTIYQFLQTNYE
jgi:hypothetical protein